MQIAKNESITVSEAIARYRDRQDISRLAQFECHASGVGYGTCVVIAKKLDSTIEAFQLAVKFHPRLQEIIIIEDLHLLISDVVHSASNPFGDLSDFLGTYTFLFAEQIEDLPW